MTACHALPSVTDANHLRVMAPPSSSPHLSLGLSLCPALHLSSCTVVPVVGRANGKCSLGKGPLLLHMNSPKLPVNRNVVLWCEELEP